MVAAHSFEMARVLSPAARCERAIITRWAGGRVKTQHMGVSRTRELDEAEEPERGDLLGVATAAAILAWRVILIMEVALLTAAAPAVAVAPVAARDEQLEREDGEHVDDEPASSSER